MKDQLERYLQPTGDMKKAIDRNSKQDEDLSLLLKQLEKEKKIALYHLTIKQDAFKKQAIKRRESLPQPFRIQFCQQRPAIRRDRPHPQESFQANRLLRRTSSCGDAPSSSKLELPEVTNKRHSLPAFLLPRDIRADFTSRLTLKAGSDIAPLGRTLNAKNEQSKQGDVSSNEDDCFEDRSSNTMHSNQFYAKSSGYTACNAIRRHSDVHTVVNLNNSRLLQRRRAATIHSMESDLTCLNGTVKRL